MEFMTHRGWGDPLYCHLAAWAQLYFLRPNIRDCCPSTTGKPGYTLTSHAIGNWSSSLVAHLEALDQGRPDAVPCPHANTTEAEGMYGLCWVNCKPWVGWP